MSPKEHEELKRQVLDRLHKDYIRESLSMCTIPTLLNLKKDETWQMCIDNQEINRITIKYRFPIPCVKDMFTGAQIFSKIDLQSSYHQIHIRL